MKSPPQSTGLRTPWPTWTAERMLIRSMNDDKGGRGQRPCSTSAANARIKRLKDLTSLGASLRRRAHPSGGYETFQQGGGFTSGEGVTTEGQRHRTHGLAVWLTPGDKGPVPHIIVTVTSVEVRLSKHKQRMVPGVPCPSIPATSQSPLNLTTIQLLTRQGL